MHHAGAITIQSNNLPFKSLQCNPKRHRACMSHRTDIEKVMRFCFASLFSQEKQFSSCSSCRYGIDGILRHIVQNDFHCFFPTHWISIVHVIRLITRRHDTLWCDQTVRLSGFFTIFDRLLHCFSKLIIVIIKDGVGDVHDFQQFGCNLPL